MASLARGMLEIASLVRAQPGTRRSGSCLVGKIEKLQPIDSVKANEKFDQEFIRRLLWQYPYHSAVDLLAKLSVTERRDAQNRRK